MKNKNFFIDAAVQPKADETHKWATLLLSL